MKGESQYKKGLWTEEEDQILMEYVKANGRGRWNRIPKITGLKRCGKSCRLRWLNYLSPNVKHGDFSEEEEDLIIRLHNLLGNRWSLIAGRVPGRTDNQVKNHWNTRLCKRLVSSKKQLRKPATSSPVKSTTVAVQEINHTYPAGNKSSDIDQLLQNSKDEVSHSNGAEELLIDQLMNEDDSFLFYNDILNFNNPGLVDLVDFLDA